MAKILNGKVMAAILAPNAMVVFPNSKPLASEQKKCIIIITSTDESRDEEDFQN